MGAKDEADDSLGGGIVFHSAQEQGVLLVLPKALRSLPSRHTEDASFYLAGHQRRLQAI